MEYETITIFGEVLVDHFPDGKMVLGGAPFNVAWHLQAFGQKPQFVSRIGDDDAGKRIVKAMNNWGLDTGFLQEDSAYPTGQVQVSIANGEPAYNILPDQAYDHIEKYSIDDISHNGILYHGTLATRSYTSKQTLAAIKILHLGRLFIDVNLRDPWWNKDEVFDLICYADCLKLNIDELTALEEHNVGDMKSRMEAFLAKNYLQSLIVTCGENGAYALTKDGGFYPVTPKKSTGKIVDTVGAGDAFSAVVLLGLNLDWDFGLIMERAQEFAGAITKQAGATTDDTAFYSKFVKSWQLNLPASKKPAQPKTAGKPETGLNADEPAKPKKSRTKPKTDSRKATHEKPKKTGAKAGSKKKGVIDRLLGR